MVLANLGRLLERLAEGNCSLLAAHLHLHNVSQRWMLTGLTGRQASREA